MFPTRIIEILNASYVFFVVLSPFQMGNILIKVGIKYKTGLYL